MVALAVFVLLVRGCVHDPIAAWWTIGVSVGLMIFIAAQGILTRQQAYAYSSVVVAMFATSVGWCHLSSANDEAFVAGFVYANVIVASLVAVWLAGARNLVSAQTWRVLGPAVSADSQYRHCWQLAAPQSWHWWESVEPRFQSRPVWQRAAPDWPLPTPGAWPPCSRLGLLLLALLWEQRIGLSLVASYLWGFIAIALVLNILQQTAVLGPGRVGARWLVVGAGLAGPPMLR